MPEVEKPNGFPPSGPVPTTVGEDGVGLLKIDFLGLRNLTIIQESLRFIKINKIKLKINKIPTFFYFEVKICEKEAMGHQNSP